MKKERIVIFGATGNLGSQCLDVVRSYSDRFDVVGLSAGSNRILLTKLQEEFSGCGGFLATAQSSTDDGFATTRAGLVSEDVDTVVFLEGGIACYQALLKAISLKKKILLANKELLVAHGGDLMYLARELQVEIIPIDSELNAISQALRGEDVRSVSRIILTASGGALRDRLWSDCAEVSAEQVLAHPTWKMGKKVTVDSATLVNKAFEVLETHFLFDVPLEKIEVRLHTTSRVHAIIEFLDGFSKLVVSEPNMKQALASALFWPERVSVVMDKGTKKFDFDEDLSFEKLESGRFPCFDWVLKIAFERPELLPALVDIDEKAVSDFLSGAISYHDILYRLMEVVDTSRPVVSLDSLVRTV